MDIRPVGSTDAAPVAPTIRTGRDRGNEPPPRRRPDHRRPPRGRAFAEADGFLIEDDAEPPEGHAGLDLLL